MKPNPRRPRPAVLSAAPRPAAARSVRASIAAALGRCTEPQRTMLALLLVERLSSAEAAATLGVPVRQFERSYAALVAQLHRAMDRTNRGRWRSAGRRADVELARLRRAA